MELEKSIFEKSAEEVALSLLQSNIKRKVGDEIISLEVNEVEIYEGFEDEASHAFRGKTKRNETMFESGGIFYVYFVYGVHYMLNVVAGKEGFPAAVLLRGAGELRGPGKLTKELQIDLSFDKKRICKKQGLWFEKRKKECRIEKTPRVGIGSAGNFWKKKPCRYIKVK